MKLYVDGALVGQNANSKYGQGGYWGYWRIGGDNLNSWPSKPSSNFFKGSLDEMALYHRELSAAEVTAHHVAGTGGNVLPTASFTETVTDLGVAVDGIDLGRPGRHDRLVRVDVRRRRHRHRRDREPHVRSGRDLSGHADRDRQRGRHGHPHQGRDGHRPERSAGRGVHQHRRTISLSRWTRPARPTPTARSPRTPGRSATAAPRTGATASHTYAAGGTYDVKLTVTDDKGAATNLTKQVTVTPPNVAPTAAFTSSGAELDKHFDATESADSDGTIASYAWDFGDGETGTGSEVDHTYATAGTYDVRLTVTDDDGATGTVTKQVVVSPPNAAPHAAFTASKDELKLSVDASDSTDSDGTVESYAWTFGDGASGTGKTATHTYLGAGTYTVELTVTDDDGSTDSVSKDVVITGPPAPFALDGFSRTVTGGWGSADIGGTWVRSGSATNFAVSNGTGTIRMGSPGAGPSISLPTVSSSDTDMRVKVGLDKMPTGGGTYIALKTRTVGSDSYYVDTKLLANGTVNVTLGRTVNGVDTSLQTKTVTGLTFNQGDKLNIRAQAVGTSGTTLRVKVWKVGSTEPVDWAASVTDSTASLQAAGGIGLGTYLTGSSTNAPVIASFSELSAAPTGN